MIKFLLLAIFVFFLLYNFGGQLRDLKFDGFETPIFSSAPCTRPISYEVGAFDARFGISKDEFLSVITKAENIWEGSVGRDLFKNISGGNLKINLIYDYRQEATLKLKELGIVVENDRASYEKILEKYNASKVIYNQKERELNSIIRAFEEWQRKYNEEVEFWNKKKGAPEDVFRRLKEEREALEVELARIRQIESLLKNMAEEINSMALVLNRLASFLNLNVERYNEIGASRGEEFEEGLYRSDSSGEAIDIYEFESKDKLVRVLEHELGHALGLPHLENKNAIMYKLNIGTNEKLTNDDIAALRSLCKIGQ